MLKMQLPLYNSKAKHRSLRGEGSISKHPNVAYLNFMKQQDTDNMQSRLNQQLDQIDEQNKLQLRISFQNTPKL